MDLTQKHKHTLLSIAEWSITDFLTNGRMRALPDTFELDPVLKSKCGAFVTVYVDCKLRGCIGTFSEKEALYDNVHHLAIQAATEDRRFEPIKESELKGLTVEISVLLPRERISGPEDIIIGRHGVYMIHGIKRATLLPQVAVEYGWSPVEFLECCAKNKLGLSKNSWQEAELYVYEAVVFS